LSHCGKWAVAGCAEPAAALVQAVTAALAEFVAGAPQADDITLVIAKRNC
jgi:serine phosphatase RsbU (regulator of sigma subunit)